MSVISPESQGAASAAPGPDFAPGPFAAPGPLIAGGVLLIAGGILFAQAAGAAAENGVTLGGPTLAPLVVTGLWLVSAIGYLAGQLRSRLRGPSPRQRSAADSASRSAAEDPGTVRGPAVGDSGNVSAVAAAADSARVPAVSEADDPGLAGGDSGNVSALSVGRDSAAGGAEGVRWRTPFLLLGALVGYALVLKYTVAGYVLATAAFVLLSARLMSTRPWREVIVRDLATAAGLSLGIYLVFTRLLGIVLPAGVLPL